MLSSVSFSDVLFSGPNDRSIDFRGIYSGVADSNGINLAYGINGKTEVGINAYFSDVSGIAVQLYAPFVQYYFLKPHENNNLMLSTTFQYMMLQASFGAASMDMRGYNIEGNFGYNVGIAEKVLLVPYVGILYNKFKAFAVEQDDLYPKIGAYVGFDMGKRNYVYFKYESVLQDGQFNNESDIGFHYNI